MYKVIPWSNPGGQWSGDRSLGGGLYCKTGAGQLAYPASALIPFWHGYLVRDGAVVCGRFRLGRKPARFKAPSVSLVYGQRGGHPSWLPRST